MSRLTTGFMLPMVVDFGSETPLYRQISMWLQQAILAGKLQPGQRVPSTRALATELKISRISVVGAYELLIAEGYLQTFVGSGTCVSQSIPDTMLRAEAPGESIAIAPQAKARRTVSRRALGMSGPARTWLQSCCDCTNLLHFPVAVWSRFVSRHARKVSKEVVGYGDPMGYMPFREAVAEYLGAFRAVKCDPAQILVTTGSQHALQIAALALLDPNDSAWIEEPGYPGTRQALKAAGARLVPVPVDREGLNVECGLDRAKAARAAFVTPSHQFPMGVAMSAARRTALLSWAAREGGWIVEDDYDGEYRFSGSPSPSLQGLDDHGRVIYVGTFSKVMFPALRLGFMVIPKDLLKSFLDIRNASEALSTSVLYQMAMTDFIREGHLSRHIKRMRAQYMEARYSLTAAIVAQMKSLLEIVGDEAGMQLVTLLPLGTDDVEIAMKFPKMSVTVYALSQCYMRRPQTGGLMIGYANLSLKEIPAIVDALRALIHASLPKSGGRCMASEQPAEKGGVGHPGTAASSPRVEGGRWQSELPWLSARRREP